MRRFFIFLFLLFLLGCGVNSKTVVYQKSYYGDGARIEAANDALWWLDAYKKDSIPFEDWLTYQEYVGGGYKVERVYQGIWNDKTEIIINFTTCVCDSLTYHVMVLQRTKDRKYK